MEITVLPYMRCEEWCPQEDIWVFWGVGVPIYKQTWRKESWRDQSQRVVSQISRRHQFLTQWQARFSHPFTGFCNTEGTFIIPPHTGLKVLITKPRTSEEITIIKSCTSVVISAETYGQFLLHLIIVGLYFKHWHRAPCLRDLANHGMKMT